MADLIIHQSGLKTFRKCHRCWYYKYIEELEKVKKGSALLRGTCCHAMIEAKANGKDPWVPYEEFIKENKQIFIEEEELYGNIEEMICNIMEGYFKYYKNDNLIPIKIGDKFAEHKFSLPIYDGIILEGVIDMIAKDQSDRIWLVDHKTHKNIPSGDTAYYNMQSALYAFAMKALDEFPNPDGVCWNYIRWKDQTKPELLKNGTMSKKKIDTTWETYEKALLENGLNPQDYLDVKEALQNKESEFYVRQYLPLNDTILQNVYEDALTTAKQIKEYRDRPKEDFDRNLTRDCSWCEFYPLCQAELRGLDVEFMKKVDYRKKQKGEQENEESQDD